MNLLNNFLLGVAIDTPTDLEPGSYGLLIFYALVALGFSFLCSIAEAVLLSVTPSYIATLEKSGKQSAARLKRMKENVDRPLAAILSLNTIAHTVGAAGVGAEAAGIWGNTAVGYASAVMTLFILVLSEIIPKTIGAVYWRPLGPIVARVLELLIWALLPLVWLSELLTKIIAGDAKQEIVTREEVAATAAMSTETGELAEKEHHILSNLLRLHSLSVEDVMTPRTVILSSPESLTIEEFLNDNPKLPVTRIPVYENTIDEVTGFVLRSELLLAQARNEADKQLKSLRRPIKTISPSASLSDALELLLNEREHIALVVDNYGGTDGLVTLEDIIETLLGIEIVDEADETVDMQRLARRQWKQRMENIGLAVNENDDESPNSSAPPKQE